MCVLLTKLTSSSLLSTGPLTPTPSLPSGGAPVSYFREGVQLPPLEMAARVPGLFLVGWSHTSLPTFWNILGWWVLSDCQHHLLPRSGLQPCWAFLYPEVMGTCPPMLPPLGYACLILLEIMGCSSWLKQLTLSHSLEQGRTEHVVGFELGTAV